MREARVILLAVALLLLLAAPARAYKLERAMMTASEPPPCSIAWYQPPTPATSFPASDARAWLWFAVSDAKAGDRARSEYYTPSGRRYEPAEGEWEGLRQIGNVCFTDTPLRIAGTAVAAQPGVWKVRVTYNDAPLFELSFTVGGAQACSYVVSPLSHTLGAAGGAGTVAVQAGAGCAWSASSNTPWIVVAPGASGSGNGSVMFTAAPNADASQRTGTLTVAGQTVTLTQAGAVTSTGPRIAPGGVLNAASFAAAGAPGSAIARGSLFTIFGERIGPAAAAQAMEYPLSPSLGGVTIRVTRGTESVDALPLFVSPTQINAVMPSSAPLGEARIAVAYQGQVSAEAPVSIFETGFGIFTMESGRGAAIFQNYVSLEDQPLNTPSNTVKPGQVGTLWGTGLGAVPGGIDAMAPPAGDLPAPVEVYVGGRPARKLYGGRSPCCSGVDQIVFEVPPDAPPGCATPVQVRAAGTYSNIATISIDASGAPCR